MASKAYRARKLEQRRLWSRNANAAKARKRELSTADAPGWVCTGTYIIRTFAAPDHRTMELHVFGGRDQLYRCGSERAVRGALSRLLWRQESD